MSATGEGRIPLLSREEARAAGEEVGLNAAIAELNVFRALLHQPKAVRPVEVRPAEVRPVEVGSAEVRPAEVGLAEVRPAEVRIAEVRSNIWAILSPLIPRLDALLEGPHVFLIRHRSSRRLP